MENTSTRTKKTLGRRKIEIKKIDNKTSLQVTFSKRRRGLFRKASELAVLCGAELAILVQSPAKKMFTFAHPSVEALINRASPSPAAAGHIARRCDDGRRKLEEATKMLEMAEKETSGGGFWWRESFEGLELHELEEYLKALEELEENVAQRLRVSAPSSTSSPPDEDFFRFEPVQDFCTSSSSIQESGDESWLHPYDMIMENGYGLEFLDC